MTADELEWLAVVQVDIRLRYEIARHHAHSWQPAPAPPPPARLPPSTVVGQ